MGVWRKCYPRLCSPPLSFPNKISHVIVHKLFLSSSTLTVAAFRFKFDDERVTKEDMKRALEEQYGGEEEVTFSCTSI